MSLVLDHLCTLILQLGRTPLQEAVSSQRHTHLKKVVEALIKAGADVNIADKVSCLLSLILVRKVALKSIIYIVLVSFEKCNVL